MTAVLVLLFLVWSTGYIDLRISDIGFFMQSALPETLRGTAITIEPRMEGIASLSELIPKQVSVSLEAFQFMAYSQIVVTVGSHHNT